MAEIAVTVQASGEAYVAWGPDVRDSVALEAMEAADAIPALDGIVLDFDHYGRVVGLRITGAVDSILAPSLLEGEAAIRFALQASTSALACSTLAPDEPRARWQGVVRPLQS